LVYVKAVVVEAAAEAEVEAEVEAAVEVVEAVVVVSNIIFSLTDKIRNGKKIRLVRTVLIIRNGIKGSLEVVQSCMTKMHFFFI
jgi:hypothetical protein